jgi:prophage antirepressor-like protein|nr:MAG TPA: repressor domain protein [Caudoviricetes sp.]
MSEITVFNFEQKRVRSTLVNGVPYFVGRDVAAVLGYAKPQNAILHHCKGALKRGILTNGGNQELLIIPESDVYRLVIHSRLPEAEKFERWIMEDVLPSIRQTGGYKTNNPDRINIDIAEYIGLLKFKIDVLEKSAEKHSNVPISEAEKHEICDLYKRGATIGSISRQLNRSEYGVRYTLVKAGLKAA